jgi:hypothetical protein
MKDCWKKLNYATLTSAYNYIIDSGPLLAAEDTNGFASHPCSDVRRRGDAAVAGFAREHAQAIRTADRSPLDLPAGD